MHGDPTGNSTGTELRRQILRQKKIARLLVAVALTGSLLILGWFVLSPGKSTDVQPAGPDIVQSPAFSPAESARSLQTDSVAVVPDSKTIFPPLEKKTIARVEATGPRIPPPQPVLSMVVQPAETPRSPGSDSPLAQLEKLYTTGAEIDEQTAAAADPLVRALIRRKQTRQSEMMTILQGIPVTAPEYQTAQRLLRLIFCEAGRATEFSAMTPDAPVALWTLFQAATDENQIRPDRYGLIDTAGFFRISEEMIATLPGDPTGLRDNQTGALVFAFLRGGGVEVRRKKDGRKKFLADLFDFEMTRQGSVELRYGGPGSSRPAVAGRGELDGLRATLTPRAEQLLRVSFSPDERSVAIMERDGTISLFDAATAMSRHQVRRPHLPAADCRPFAWPRGGSTPDGRLLYLLYNRERNTASVARFDVQRLEENRIVSVKTAGNTFQGIGVLDRRAVFFSCLPEDESRPAVYVCGHFGRHSQRLLDDAAWPVVMPSLPGFWFLRGRELWQAGIQPVDTAECMLWLKSLDPRKALVRLTDWEDICTGSQWQSFRDQLKGHVAEINAVLIFEEARLLESVCAVAAAGSLYEQLIREAPDAWREAARSARDRLEVISRDGNGQ